MTAAALRPRPAPRFDSPAAWSGVEMARSRGWIHCLDGRQQADLLALGERLLARGATPAQARLLASDSTTLASLRPLMGTIREELRRGRGFALMRGFPADRMSTASARLAYAALGSLLGDAMPQNKKGELIHDVRDTGADRHDVNVRLSITNAEQDFHTDGADLIGLLCLQKAKAGGVSRIVSSVTVYHHVASTRPDLAALLFEPWYFHMKGEQREGELPYFQLPIARVIGDQLSSFFIGWYIRHAEQLPGVPKLTAMQHEALAAYEQAANHPDLHLDMHFEPGDIQWLKNSVILHKRTEYEDWPEPGRKRHLLRLWLAAPDFGDGIVALRQGHQVERT
ncbi:MAG TPA: TauD/TfdA family dioxygenase [Nevskiaceae bacterium]|nr:TauD/TfdA family dioxygenase [Nevskiaceae bacterium]